MDFLQVSLLSSQDIEQKEGEKTGGERTCLTICADDRERLAASPALKPLGSHLIRGCLPYLDLTHWLYVGIAAGLFFENLQ